MLQGFKSEEEKKAYFDELGDPFKHPLFAATTEDLEGHPLAEAFRVLREEDKTPIELATMYKDEGNEWIKKNTLKDTNEAIIRYTHALTFLDGKDVNCEDPVALELRSQILSNRALAAMNNKNYGTALTDIAKVPLMLN